MNPNPANNQSLNDTNNNQPHEAQLPQLEKETPLDITIYPNNENPNSITEPQKIESIAPLETFSEIKSENNFSIKPVENTVTSNPVQVELSTNNPVENTRPTNIPLVDEVPNPTPNPINDLSFNSVSNSSTTQLPEETSSLTTPKPSSQKLTIIIGVITGIVIVGISSFYLLSNSNKPSAPTQENLVKNQPPETPVSSLTPTQNLTLNEYQLKIDSFYTRYNNTISGNPIDLTKATLSVDSVRFVSDEIFMIATEIDELNIPANLKENNQKLSIEFKKLVNAYDVLLMNYKVSNTLNAETKNNFNVSIKTSNDNLKATVDIIKNLKQ
jgi:hypothetical protein